MIRHSAAWSAGAIRFAIAPYALLKLSIEHMGTKMTNKLAVALAGILVGWSSITHGQEATPPPPPAAAASSYCAVSPGANGEEHLKTIRKGCRAGDVVIIPRRHLFVAAVMCDLSRAITVVDDVICVLGRERTQKNARSIWGDLNHSQSPLVAAKAGTQPVGRISEA